MTKIPLLLLIFLLSALALEAQGPISGFLPGRHRTDVALTYTYEHFNFYFFGDQRNWRPVTTHSVNLFLEHGFSDTLSLVVTAPYRRIDPVNQGFQDGVIALKYRNHYRTHAWGSSTFLTSVGLSLPLSHYPIETGNPIGVRATTFQGRILSQSQFSSGIFLHVQTGLDFRIIPTPITAIPVLGRLGWAGRHWFIEGWMEYFHAFSPGVDTRISGGSGSRWWRLGGSLYYGLSSDFGLVMHASYFLSGRNIGQATQLGGGIVYKIDRNAKRDRSRPSAAAFPKAEGVPYGVRAAGAGDRVLPLYSR